MKKRTTLFALIATTTIALAHSGATGVVKERMDGMSSLGQSMKALVEMAKTGAIDNDQVIEIAGQIKDQSGQSMTQRFPAGKQQMVSEASPAIWENWQQFERISEELFQAAVALEASAVDGNMDLNQAIKQLGASCSSCHKDFRIKKN